MRLLPDRVVESLALRWRRWAAPRTREGVGPILSAARAVLRRKRYCLLATLGDGEIDARVLQPFAADRDFTVWMGTRRGSRKVEQLVRNPAATLAYEDDAHQACVVLIGQAAVVDDLAERRARWRPLWRAFWPDGPEADDYVLLRFTPSRIEVWDARRRITPAPFGLRSAAVVRGPGGGWVAGLSAPAGVSVRAERRPCEAGPESKREQGPRARYFPFFARSSK